MIFQPEAKVKLSALQILYGHNDHGLSRLIHGYWFLKKLLEIGIVH